jgi:hypothetical protein
LILELRLACSSLKVGCGFMMDRPEMAMVGKRSFAEVVGDTKRTEKKGSLLLEPITGVGLLAGKMPASECDRCEKAPLSTKSMSELTHTSLETGEYLQQPQTTSGMNQEVGGAGSIRRSSEWPSVMQRAMSCNPRGSELGVERQGAQSKVKGRMEGLFNAKQ